MLCFLNVTWMYVGAWGKGMKHISIFQLCSPMPQIRDTFIVSFLPEAERIIYNIKKAEAQEVME